MSDKFYNWLTRKYGYGEEKFSELENEDPKFAEILINEFVSIATSY